MMLAVRPRVNSPLMRKIDALVAARAAAAPPPIIVEKPAPAPPPIPRVKIPLRPHLVILQEVCAKHGVTHGELLKRSRTRRICWIRYEVMWRWHTELGVSLPWIGRRLKRDHTTVLHGLRRWAERHGLPAPPSRSERAAA